MGRRTSVPTIRIGTVPKHLEHVLGRWSPKDPSGWQDWLRTKPAAWAALEQVVEAGLIRRFVVDHLMEIHASAYLQGTMSREDFARCIKIVEDYIGVLMVLEKGDVAFLVGLGAFDSSDTAMEDEHVPDEVPVEAPLAHLMGGAQALLRRMKQTQHLVSRRDSTRRNYMLAMLARYSRWATGNTLDTQWSEIIGAILGEPFSMERWRRDHRAWLRGGKTEARLDRLAAQGKIPPPQKRPRASRASGVTKRR